MPRRYKRERRYSSTVLDLDIKWRWMVSFTSLLLYPREIGSCGWGVKLFRSN
jgi:hypothetical protein